MPMREVSWNAPRLFWNGYWNIAPTTRWLNRTWCMFGWSWRSANKQTTSIVTSRSRSDTSGTSLDRRASRHQLLQRKVQPCPQAFALAIVIDKRLSVAVVIGDEEGCIQPLAAVHEIGLVADFFYVIAAH